MRPCALTGTALAAAIALTSVAETYRVVSRDRWGLRGGVERLFVDIVRMWSAGFTMKSATLPAVTRRAADLGYCTVSGPGGSVCPT